MQESEVKAKIQTLIDDFRANYSKYEHGSEDDTETGLIEPLFYALGWIKADFDKRSQARREGKRGIADYAFKINDRIVFFLEAKKVGIPLEKEADKQVISYALSKRIPFAVSTNFEELKIFCVEYEDALTQTFRTFRKPENYLDDLKGLLYLAKENFENGTTLEKAEEENRLKKRVAIDKIFLEDLMQMRKLIADDIEKTYSTKYELNEKEEIVQRIIDRLIFIRRCEDEGINPDNLSLKTITELPHDEAYPKLKNYFKEYNEVYNSGLFAINVDNDCDKIKIEGSIIKKLIEYLYDSKNK
ncbi:MAG: type I restriction enzyme HsdR N-terminal domain-containing protein, partial [archaeon]|nr:type I restriction enzyme HsdR N-terminal domain-containing protein [archaeon]